MGAQMEVDVFKANCDPGFWQRQSSLDGIFRKFGQNLPWVDRVPGNVLIDEITSSVITGNLISEDASFSLRFEAKDLKDLQKLRNHISIMPNHALIPMRMSGRGWVERDGRIVLLVRWFEIQPGAGRVS